MLFPVLTRLIDLLIQYIIKETESKAVFFLSKENKFWRAYPFSSKLHLPARRMFFVVVEILSHKIHAALIVVVVLHPKAKSTSTVTGLSSYS